RLRDRLVLRELGDEGVRFGGVAAAEDGAGVLVDVADLVLALAGAAEVHAVEVVHDREDAAADRDARLSGMAGFGPGVAERADLLRLLDVQRLAALVPL